MLTLSIPELCPSHKTSMGGGSVSLLRVKQLEVELLSAEQKTWIARHVVDGTASASDLGKRYGLKRNTITRWASRLRAGHIIEEGVGRPSSLDTLSIEKVVVQALTWLVMMIFTPLIFSATGVGAKQESRARSISRGLLSLSCICIIE